jgi:hypothetical protein
MSTAPWLFKPKTIKRVEKALTEAGLKIVAAIFHPDGSFEFRTTKPDTPANDLDRELQEFGARHGQN